MLKTNKVFDCKIETERLVIRPVENDDYKNWLDAFESRFPSQYRHDKGQMDMSECTEEWFIQLVKKHQELALNDIAYVFGIFHKEDGEHIGIADFSIFARDVFQWGRIGYAIHNQLWQKGYGKEAVKAAIQIGFRDLNFHRIEAHINIDNPPSIQVAKSVGMKYECKREGFIYEYGEWTDHLVYYINAK